MEIIFRKSSNKNSKYQETIGTAFNSYQTMMIRIFNVVYKIDF